MNESAVFSFLIDEPQVMTVAAGPGLKPGFCPSQGHVLFSWTNQRYWDYGDR